MKKLTIPLLAVILMLFAHLTLSQEKNATEENPSYQLRVIHIDNVKPAMMQEYESIAKELSTLLAKYQIQDVQYSGLWNDEGQFYWFSKINSMADLDKKMFASLEEKAGKDVVKNIMMKFNDCIITHSTQILAYWPDLSYKPEVKEGDKSEINNFRTWNFWYFDASKNEDAKKILQDWKSLYQKHNIDMGYGIYSVIFGTEGPGYVLVASAKDAEHFAQLDKDIIKKLGEEGENLLERTLKITTKMETITGWYMPELSYIPPVPVASGN